MSEKSAEEAQQTEPEAEAEAGGSARIRTLATFMAGVLVGAGLTLLAPQDAASGGPGRAPGEPPAMVGAGATPPPNEGAPGGAPGAPGGVPGTPGEVGTPGAVAGVPGAPPGDPGAIPGGTMPTGAAPGGTVPGAPGDPAVTGVPGGVGTPVAGAITPGLQPATVDPNLPPASGAVGIPDGPPLGEGTAAPQGATPLGGTRIEKHLRAAPTAWANLAEQARSSSRAEARALVPEIQTQIENIPKITDTLPPMPEVAGYLASSKVLLNELRAAGLDVTELSLTIDTLMRPPKAPFKDGQPGNK